MSNEKSIINFVRLRVVDYLSQQHYFVEGFDQADRNSDEPVFSKHFNTPLSALICLSKIQETNKNLGLPLLIVELDGFPDKFPEQKTLTDF